jgi:hypothetical protein
MQVLIALEKGRHPVIRLDGLHERDVNVAALDEGSAELGIAVFDLPERRWRSIGKGPERVA